MNGFALTGLVQYDDKMKLCLVILLLLSMSLQAEIYRSVDSRGNISYSDVKAENAQEITIDIAPSYTAPPIVALPTVQPVQPLANIAYKVVINSPKHNETLANPEVVTVVATISPDFTNSSNNKIVFSLDGKKIASAQTSLTIELVELARGSHIISAAIVNQKGKVITQSKSVLFHIQRHSIAR